MDEVLKAVGGGYCRLPMPLKLALAVRETVAGHRLGTLEGGGGGLPIIPGYDQTNHIHCRCLYTLPSLSIPLPFPPASLSSRWRHKHVCAVQPPPPPPLPFCLSTSATHECEWALGVSSLHKWCHADS